MKLYFIAVITWAGTAAAIAESNSHGNWNNEKGLPVHSYPYEVKNIGDAETIEESTSTLENGSYDSNADISSSLKYFTDLATLSSMDNQFSEVKEELTVATIDGGNGPNNKNNSSVEFDGRSPLQIIQPYVVELEKKISTEEGIDIDSAGDNSEELSRSIRTNHKEGNENFTIEYSPGEKIISLEYRNDPAEYASIQGSSSDESLGSYEYAEINNSGGFGQRVRSSPSSRVQSSEQFTRNDQNLPLEGNTSSITDTRGHKKRHRVKNSRARILSFLSKKPTSFEDAYRTPSTSIKDVEYQADIRDYSQEYTNAGYSQDNAGKLIGVSQVNDKNSQQEYIIRNNEKQNYAATTSTFEDAQSSPATTTLSLGKFSGPIVVPELSQYKTFPYITTNKSKNNDVSSASKPSSSPAETKTIESNYLTTSSAILNPLQVGVTLVNAGEILNNTDDPSTPISDHPRNDYQKLENIAAVTKNVEINPTVDSSGKPEFQDDQQVQQEQISEVVTQKTPVQTVEVQKSVEVYHTAPIQEIHYPLEFIPQVQQLSGKQRFTELENSVNPHKVSQTPTVTDQRFAQVFFNVYKSNEILDEKLQQKTQDRDRYEYNANENDLNRILPSSSISTSVYSSLGGQSQPVSAIKQNIDDKLTLRGNDHSSDALYEQSEYTRNTAHLRTRPKITGQEILKDFDKQPVFNFGKDIVLGVTREEQLQSARSGQSIENSPDFSYLKETEGPNQEISQFSFTKVSQNNPQMETKFLLPIPQPYPVEKIIEKTVHVPLPVEVEKVIEKKIPYTVEKVIEKQIPVPQPFPVHIQVPVDRIVEKQIRIPQLYPIHIERLVEKKVPYALQRFIIQPYPVHIKLSPHTYSFDKSIHVPAASEKHVSRPYPTEIEKSVERSRHPLEIVKFIKSVPNHQSSIQYNPNYHQPIRTREQNVYQIASNAPYGFVNDEQNQLNNSSQLNGQLYNAYSVPNHHVALKQSAQSYSLPKKIVSYSNYATQSAVPSYSTLNGNPQSYRRQPITEKDKIKDEYRNSLANRQVPVTTGIQSKLSQFPVGDIGQSLVTTSPMRRARQESPMSGSPGAFRQSKVEYGFKPPMVPSIQYDEKTATKVE